MSLNILLYIILIIIFIELSIYFIIKNLKKDFKWLINSDDEKPIFDKKKLQKFYKDSYDEILGWDRKKNSSGFENSQKKTFFKISSSGTRGKSKFKNTKISVFGDSFAFCRYVNDNETWEKLIEDKLRSNVHNYGVGNYGLDQSFLKYLKLKKKVKGKIVIFNFVPETIARINSYWKHYREFGNIMAFKPIYILQKNKLILKKTIIEKGYTQEKIYKKINLIKKFDIFYDRKFKNEKFIFPYIFCYLKNIKKFSIIILNLILYRLSKKRLFEENALSEVLLHNIEQSHEMYKDKILSEKLKLLILMINKQIKKDKKKMLLIISPQLLDLKGKYLKYSQNFFSSLPKEILCLDLSKTILKKNYNKFYLGDKYGGHFNKNGNKYISKIIFNYLRTIKYI